MEKVELKNFEASKKDLYPESQVSLTKTIAELQRRIEELTKTNEELRLEAAIPDKTTDAIFLRGMDHIIVYVNEAASKIYGYRRDELIGKDDSIIVPPDERPAFEKRLRILLNQGEITAEVTHLRKDKSLIPIESHTHLIKIGGKEYILTVSRDITQRRKAQEAMQASEEKYRILVENANEAIFVARDGRLQFVNPRTSEITGYTAQELTAKPFADFIYPDDREMVIERHQKRLKGEIAPSQYDFRIIHKDGTLRWVELHVVLINWEGRPATLNMLTDITERLEAERKIRQDELQFEKLFNAMTEGVALISPEGIVLKTNRAEKKIMGLEDTKYVGQHFKIQGIQHLRADGTEMPLEEMAVSLAIKRKRPVRDMEVINIDSNGTTHWFNINAVPILDQQGEVSYIVRTLADITEKRQLQTEKETFTKRLIETQEDERKRIAHELHEDIAQNLALALMEIDNILHLKETLPEKYLSRLEKLKEDISRTQGDIRRYAHDLRPGVLDYLGLEAALEGLADDLNDRYGIKTDLKISGEKRPLSEEIEIVLFRIAQEAAKNIREHAQATQAKIRLKWMPDKVKLTISDIGKGFKLAATKKSGAKNGLGLIDMQERADLINARLDIRTGPGKGTVVSVVVETQQ